jgi:hypothetical protein
MRLTMAQAYAVGAVLSGVLWSLLVYVGKSPSVTTTDLAVFLLAGSGTGLAVSHIFRSAFRRAGLPWALFLPLATVPAGISIFAGLVWAARLGPVTRGLEFFSDLCTALLFSYPMVYLLAFINQWALQRVLLEHGAYRPRSRWIIFGTLFLWIAFLFWFTAF